MKKIVSSLAIACVLALSVSSSALAASKVYLSPAYEKTAKTFMQSAKSMKSDAKYADDADYYEYLTTLEEQLKAYKAKNSKNSAKKNLAIRLLSDLATLKAQYAPDESDDGNDDMTGILGVSGAHDTGVVKPVTGGPDPKPVVKVTTGGPDPKPTVTSGPVAIPTTCMGRPVAYRDAVGYNGRIDYRPFEAKAYIYKFHTKDAAYLARLSIAHDSASAMSFISEKPCDIASAVANAQVSYGWVMQDRYVIVSDPASGLKQKWADLVSQGIRTGGYSYTFLDSGKDYYLTTMHTSIDVNQLSGITKAEDASKKIMELAGPQPAINGCGQESTPPYAVSQTCFYNYVDLYVMERGLNDIDVANPWPQVYARQCVALGFGAKWNGTMCVK